VPDESQPLIDDLEDRQRLHPGRGSLIHIAQIELHLGETLQVASEAGRIALRPCESNASAEDFERSSRITLRECEQAPPVAEADGQSCVGPTATQRDRLVVHLARERKLAGSFAHESGTVEGPRKELWIPYLPGRRNGGFGKCSACAVVGLAPRQACRHRQGRDTQRLVWLRLSEQIENELSRPRLSAEVGIRDLEREPQTTVLRVLPPPVERVPEVGRLQRLPHPRAEVVVVTLLDRLQLTGCAQLLVGEVMVGFEQAVPCPAVAQPVGDDH